MNSFKGAVEVGAHAIETDIHLSKDDVVVLSHVSGVLFSNSLC
jgi:glycerophosphoryl diester phosphodiesterase